MQTVADLTALHPLAIRALERHGIEHCCGGGRPLEQACADSGIDVEHLLEEVLQDETSATLAIDWNSRPLPQLIDHILEHYHKPLDTELPRLEALARKVLQAHAATHRAQLVSVLNAFEALRERLEQHMFKQETALFPGIRSGQLKGKSQPLTNMLREHESEAWLLKCLRRLTDDYLVPAEACPAWKALWQGFEDLEQSLQDHARLEDQVLIPRILHGE